MSRIIRTRYRMPTFLLFAVMLLAAPARSQDQRLFTMNPVGDEAFGIILQAYEYDRDLPLNAVVMETLDMENCTRQLIAFDSAGDSRVPCYLAIPKTGTAPFPCVILLHGHTGNKGEWWRDDSYYGGGLVSKAFLSNGFAVLALDARYHGERRPASEDLMPGSLYSKHRYSRTVDMIVDSVVDYRRAVDYIETRPEIDAARIGVHGYSMGGMMTFLLTGTEPRIKVTVSCVTWNWDNPTPKYQYIAPYNFARAIGNRPFLMMMGRKDPILPLDGAERLYHLVEKPSTKLILYDSDHRLPDDYIGESLKWMQGHL